MDFGALPSGARDVFCAADLRGDVLVLRGRERIPAGGGVPVTGCGAGSAGDPTARARAAVADLADDGIEFLDGCHEARDLEHERFAAVQKVLERGAVVRHQVMVATAGAPAR